MDILNIYIGITVYLGNVLRSYVYRTRRTIILAKA